MGAGLGELSEQGRGKKCYVGEKRKAVRRSGPPSYELALEWLYGLYVLCLPALRSLDNGELNGLTFLQAAESACLDGRVMDENVFAVLTADEAVALRVIEPLNCSLFHGDACSFEIECSYNSTVLWSKQGCCKAGTAAYNVDQSSKIIIAV